MSQPCRLPQGGRIDRTKRVRFTWDGRPLEGFAGDTLASALLANDIHLVGRSFKYHRPRGIVSAGAEEPNALIQVTRSGGRTDPNLRATEIELYDGLRAESQNRWPSLKVDLGGINDRLAPFLPAGFYYKTFKWPASWWHKVYEPRIRAAAGLGRAPADPDPDRYLHRHAHGDVLVVGGGPAGLMAALAAGRSGARVILVEREAELGGWLLTDRAAVEPGWVDAVRAELEAMAEVTILTRTVCFGYFDHNYLGLLERVTDHLALLPDEMPRQRLWRVRAKAVVLAAGAIERPLVFPENDRPGIMLAGAARSYLERFAVRPGQRVVVVTNNDSAYAAALAARTAGAVVEAVVDLRRELAGELPRAALAAGIPVLPGHTLAGTEGHWRVGAALVVPLRADGTVGPDMPRSYACDHLLMSGGWNPTVHLFSQARGRLRFDEAIAAFVPAMAAQGARSAGACNGTMTLRAALLEGAHAGVAAAADAGFETTDPALPEVQERHEAPLLPVWALPHGRREAKVRAFVDFQNDVTAKDLGLAVQEGFRSIEHVKRYTTTGMGTDQGKTSNVNALAIVAAKLGTSIEAVGTTTFRPPYTPVTFGAIAGAGFEDLFDPIRLTPLHDWHVHQGAVFEDVGQWKRARYYPRGAESMHGSVHRECKAVREAVGMVDASTLGKIDIQGPDAAEFLNRVYTNAWKKLAVGRCRYGLMLMDDGFVFDDGVTSRLGPCRYHMTTTTGGAARVLAHLEEWLQTEWPDLRVYCTSVTEEWAVIALSGPNARALLRAVGTDIDLDPGAFPHLSVREGTVAGVAARVFRVSFTGEVSYELNVAPAAARALWQRLWDVGQALGVTAYGTEAMHVLRAEKGYIIAGQETDGTVTPFDLGMDWIIGRQKPDFIGKRGLARRDLVAPGRKQLVGLLTEDPSEVLEEGAQVTLSERGTPPVPMIGHVTSSYPSPTLGRSIALAMVQDGSSRHGQTLYVPMPGKVVRVTPVSPVFYDPEGQRLHA